MNRIGKALTYGFGNDDRLLFELDELPQDPLRREDGPTETCVRIRRNGELTREAITLPLAAPWEILSRLTEDRPHGSE